MGDGALFTRVGDLGKCAVEPELEPGEQLVPRWEQPVVDEHGPNRSGLILRAGLVEVGVSAQGWGGEHSGDQRAGDGAAFEGVDDLRRSTLEPPLSQMRDGVC